MGTNFYLRQKLSQDQRKEINKALDNGDFTKARELLPKDIHIGKRNGGWKFHWDHNYFQYYKPSKESLIEWLKSGQIVDEYGDEFTFDQFWNEEIAHFLYEGYDMDSFAKKYPHESGGWWDMEGRKQKLLRRCPELKNIEFSNQGDFYIDNLRFSVLTDFS